MTTRVKAVFDGEVLRPEHPLSLPQNSEVMLTIETPAEPTGKPYQSLDAALGAGIAGPPDWSENLHDYLYPEPETRHE